MKRENRPAGGSPNDNTTPSIAERSEGAHLLDALIVFARRYVVMSDSQAVAVALWTVHTHALDGCEQSPLLAITSAEKRSGKTRLLDVLELLVSNPWRVITPSEAVVFRKIDADSPTLLLDEVDAIFNPKANGATEGLRALLNAGNRAGTMVPRCVGPSQALTSFSVFCPKALAGIRDLPETISDRSIPIRLKRRAPSEPVERFRRRDAEEQAESLGLWLRAWADHHLPALTEARPELPDDLNDRAQDAWEPLLAIADRAGGEWPKRARAAAVRLSADDATDDESAGVQLLHDINAVSTAQEEDRISSVGLAAELHEIEESPWGEWYGKPISAHGIAKLLRQFEIRPRTVRFDDGTTAKGYLFSQFADAFARYLPEKPSQRHNPLIEPKTDDGESSVTDSNRNNVTTRMDSGIESTFGPSDAEPDLAWIEGCDVVTVESAGNRAEDDPDALQDELERLRLKLVEGAGGDVS
jgi:Protein of unknown function (DUF3631)